MITAISQSRFAAPQRVQRQAFGKEKGLEAMAINNAVRKAEVTKGIEKLKVILDLLKENKG